MNVSSRLREEVLPEYPIAEPDVIVPADGRRLFASESPQLDVGRQHVH